MSSLNLELRGKPRTPSGAGGSSPFRTGMAVYLFYLLIITLAPYESSIDRFLSLVRELPAFSPTLVPLKPFDLVANILLFLPFGFLLFPLLGPMTGIRLVKKRLRATSLGLGLSACIETAQMFIPPRYSSVIDAAMNALGTFLGFLIAERFFRRWPANRPSLEKFFRRSRPVLMTFYAAAVLFLSVLPSRVNDFKGWRRDFPLIIGNEATGDRPWRGEVSRLSIFDRALSGCDVRGLAKAGLEGSIAAGRQFPTDPVLYCPLTRDEGDTVVECICNSLVKQPFRLKAQSLHWLTAESGLRITGEQPLSCMDSCGTLTDALKNASQMTISIWLRTAALNQSGPARIVTLSLNTDERNFTLAQDGSGLVFRVRTRQAGPNGSKIRPVAPEAIQDLGWHHVSAVFNRGYGRIFVDGQPVGRPVRVPDDYLPDLFGMGWSLFSKIAFWMALLLPFGLMASGCAGNRRKWMGFAASVLLAGAVQGLYFCYIGQPFGF